MSAFARRPMISIFWPCVKWAVVETSTEDLVEMAEIFGRQAKADCDATPFIFKMAMNAIFEKL